MPNALLLILNSCRSLQVYTTQVYTVYNFLEMKLENV